VVPRVAFADYSLARCDNAWTSAEPDPLLNKDGETTVGDEPMMLNDAWRMGSWLWNGNVQSGLAKDDAEPDRICAISECNNPRKRQCAIAVKGGGMATFFTMNKNQKKWLWNRLFMAHVNDDAIDDEGNCKYDTDDASPGESPAIQYATHTFKGATDEKLMAIFRDAFNDEYLAQGPGIEVQKIVRGGCLKVPQEVEQVEHYGFVPNKIRHCKPPK